VRVSEVALSVNNLTCVRGYTHVFSGLSFETHPEQILHLRGPNGSGKSSLLLILANLLQPRQGSVLWQGKVSHTSLSHVHFIHHKTAIQPLLTVRENLTLWAAVLQASSSACDKALHSLDLTAFHNTLGSKLSQGQKQRLHLARLLLCKRPLWLLDEPFANLDALGKETLLQLLKQHKKDGGATILASHQPIDTLRTQTLEMRKNCA